jgi:hypothetical protein
MNQMEEIIYYKKPYHQILIQLFQKTPKEVVDPPKNTTLYKKFINNKTSFCTKHSLDKTDEAKQLCLKEIEKKEDNNVVLSPMFPKSYSEFITQNYHESITKWFLDMSDTKCAEVFFPH